MFLVVSQIKGPFKGVYRDYVGIMEMETTV